jgi:WXG100 family type VII secretion target
VPTYTFNFSLAEGTCSDMSTITSNIQNMLTDLEQEVQGSLQEWTSDARDAYNVSKAKWDAAAAKMPEALGRAQNALTEISSGYSQVERAGGNMWGGGA